MVEVSPAPGHVANAIELHLELARDALSTLEDALLNIDEQASEVRHINDSLARAAPQADHALEARIKCLESMLSQIAGRIYTAVRVLHQAENLDYDAHLALHALEAAGWMADRGASIASTAGFEPVIGNADRWMFGEELSGAVKALGKGSRHG